MAETRSSSRASQRSSTSRANENGRSSATTAYSLDLDALPMSPVEGYDGALGLDDKRARAEHLKSGSPVHRENNVGGGEGGNAGSNNIVKQNNNEAWQVANGAIDDNYDVDHGVGGPTDFTQDMEYWMNATLDHSNNAGANAGAGHEANGLLDGLLDGEKCVPQDGKLAGGLETGFEQSGGNGSNNGDVKASGHTNSSREAELERIFDDNISHHSFSALSLDGNHGTILSSPQKGPGEVANGGENTQPRVLRQPTVEEIDDSALRPFRFGQDRFSGRADDGTFHGLYGGSSLPGTTEAVVGSAVESGQDESTPRGNNTWPQKKTVMGDVYGTFPPELKDMEGERTVLQAEDYRNPDPLQQQPNFPLNLDDLAFQLSNLQTGAIGQNFDSMEYNQGTAQPLTTLNERDLEWRLTTLQARLKQSQMEAQAALIAARSSHKAAMETQKMRSEEEVTDLKRTIATLQRQAKESQKSAEEHLAWELVRAEKQRKREIEIVESEAYEKTTAMTLKLQKAELDLEHTKDELKRAKAEIEISSKELGNVKAELSRFKDEFARSNKPDLASQTQSYTVQHQPDEMTAQLHEPTLNLHDIAEEDEDHEDDEDAEDANKQITQLQNELAAAHTNADTRIEDMRQRAEAAVSKTANLLTKQKGDIKAANEARETAVKEAETLKAIVAEQSQALITVNTATETLKISLEQQQETVNAVLAEAQRARDENKALREDYDAVNRIVDQRIMASVREREGLWKQRLAKAEEERKELGRALLRAWGKEDCGESRIGKRQKYLYRYGGKAVEVE